jgi:hypothetical protein
MHWKAELGFHGPMKGLAEEGRKWQQGPCQWAVGRQGPCQWRGGQAGHPAGPVLTRCWSLHMQGSSGTSADAHIPNRVMGALPTSHGACVSLQGVTVQAAAGTHG